MICRISKAPIQKRAKEVFDLGPFLPINWMSDIQVKQIRTWLRFRVYVYLIDIDFLIDHVPNYISMSRHQIS